ncbi:MAG TPA: hypothetical protein VLE02_01330 [Nitrosarchaeum sp.]|nr:hypothetical protein [Nitrosarchaeum sp.]
MTNFINKALDCGKFLGLSEFVKETGYSFDPLKVNPLAECDKSFDAKVPSAECWKVCKNHLVDFMKLVKLYDEYNAEYARKFNGAKTLDLVVKKSEKASDGATKTYKKISCFECGDKILLGDQCIKCKKGLCKKCTKDYGCGAGSWCSDCDKKEKAKVTKSGKCFECGIAVLSTQTCEDCKKCICDKCSFLDKSGERFCKECNCTEETEYERVGCSICSRKCEDEVCKNCAKKASNSGICVTCKKSGEFKCLCGNITCKHCACRSTCKEKGCKVVSSIKCFECAAHNDKQCSMCPGWFCKNHSKPMEVCKNCSNLMCNKCAGTCIKQCIVCKSEVHVCCSCVFEDVICKDCESNEECSEVKKSKKESDEESESSLERVCDAHCEKRSIFTCAKCKKNSCGACAIESKKSPIHCVVCDNDYCGDCTKQRKKKCAGCGTKITVCFSCKNKDVKCSNCQKFSNKNSKEESDEDTEISEINCERCRSTFEKTCDSNYCEKCRPLKNNCVCAKCSETHSAKKKIGRPKKAKKTSECTLCHRMMWCEGNLCKDCVEKADGFGCECSICKETKGKFKCVCGNIICLNCAIRLVCKHKGCKTLSAIYCNKCNDRLCNRCCKWWCEEHSHMQTCEMCPRLICIDCIDDCMEGCKECGSIAYVCIGCGSGEVICADCQSIKSSNNSKKVEGTEVKCMRCENEFDRDIGCTTHYCKKCRSKNNCKCGKCKVTTCIYCKKSEVCDKGVCRNCSKKSHSTSKIESDEEMSDTDVSADDKVVLQKKTKKVSKDYSDKKSKLKKSSKKRCKVCSSEKTKVCKNCQELVCDRCTKECEKCGESYCNCCEVEYKCGDCEKDATSCPSCKENSYCSWCGEDLCESCIKTCECGNKYCKCCAASDGKRCLECEGRSETRCMDCEKIFKEGEDKYFCNYCENHTCEDCTTVCKKCDLVCCKDCKTIYSCEKCDTAMCHKCEYLVEKCYSCSQNLCEKCRLMCACGKYYCSNCMNNNGLKCKCRYKISESNKKLSVSKKKCKREKCDECGNYSDMMEHCSFCPCPICPGCVKKNCVKCDVCKYELECNICEKCEGEDTVCTDCKSRKPKAKFFFDKKNTTSKTLKSNKVDNLTCKKCCHLFERSTKKCATKYCYECRPIENNCTCKKCAKVSECKNCFASNKNKDMCNICHQYMCENCLGQCRCRESICKKCAKKCESCGFLQCEDCGYQYNCNECKENIDVCKKCVNRAECDLCKCYLCEQCKLQCDECGNNYCSKCNVKGCEKCLPNLDSDESSSYKETKGNAVCKKRQ